MKVRAGDMWRYAREIVGGARARNELMLAATRSQDIAPYLSGRSLSVLDLANGSLRPQYLILYAQGHSVYGIDWVNQTTNSASAFAYQFARGLLARQIGVPRGNVPARLLCGNVNELPFRETSFDLVTSVAAFEHFLDVPRVLSEAYRVLRPGGVIWACIHLFTSPSGGHNIGYAGEKLEHLPDGIVPWDHLRERRVPFSVPLNEWRRDQYTQAFAEKFSILKAYCWVKEGEHLLTPELERELAQYDREELTCVSFNIVARKDE